MKFRNPTSHKPYQIQISQERTEFLALWQGLGIANLSAEKRSYTVPSVGQECVGVPEPSQGASVSDTEWAEEGEAHGLDLALWLLLEMEGEKKSIFMKMETLL